MKFKTFNFIVLIVITVLFWLVCTKVAFTLKLKDNPGYITSTGDLLKPNGIDSEVIIPLRDGINTMVITAHRPYYLRGENQGKLNVEMVCRASDNSIFNQFRATIPVNKLNAKTSQEVKINPPLNCKGKETTIKFTATMSGTVPSAEEYLSIHVGENDLLFFRHRVYIKDILEETNQALSLDNKFKILYYCLVGISLIPILIFSLFEIEKRE